MTDRYLFKAKRKDSEEWVQGFYMECHMAGSDGTDSCIVKLDGQVIVVDRDTLCQFTGLTDKNGNKIWENDVVKEESCGYVGVVKYVDCEYLIDWNDFPYIRRDMMFWVKERGLKVIGTKFENPELLGG